VIHTRRSKDSNNENDTQIQLINATGEKDKQLVAEGKLLFNRFWNKKMPALGNKRKEISENGTEKGIGYNQTIRRL
jgi:type I restriction enzyme M protein